MRPRCSACWRSRATTRRKAEAARNALAAARASFAPYSASPAGCVDVCTKG
ncbi:MAG: hypothetical protein COW02_01735 [Comamonadaceae bacterium CG12_big_fil_rev_8_21_14_0_65_59_15]|nr:MAG: hypothetical protein COW02_01735 [Comamonadaceae bacterium CG12_big_fil_rev_8_21_14_0_65_59_15]